MTRAHPVDARDVVDALDKATKDERVRGVLGR